MRGGGNAGADRKPGSVEDNHSSGTAVTNCLKQPTRESARDRRCRTSLRTPLFGLAPGGVYRAANCYQSRGALLPHLFTLTGRGRRYIFCGTFHGLTPPRRYLAPCPKEPGLSSVTQKVTAIAWPTPAFPGGDSTGKKQLQERCLQFDRLRSNGSANLSDRSESRPIWVCLLEPAMRANAIDRPHGGLQHVLAGKWLWAGRCSTEVKRSVASHEGERCPPTATGRSASI